MMHLLIVGFLALHAAAGHPRPTEVSERSLQELLAWEPILGNFAFNITTNSTLANRLFKIGLQLLYNFDQRNARAAFQHALLEDARCAMCAWGIAHSCGPFLNRPTKASDELAAGLAAARQASALLVEEHSSKERALIDAMQLRYPRGDEEQLPCYERYAKRLRHLRISNVELLEDPDMEVFDAEAMMVLMCDDSGYHFYTSRGDDLPPIESAATKEASELLRAALRATNQTHTYAQHLLIHSTEMSNSEAETAVQVAAQLMKNTATLQDQHLQHMTSHTNLRTGHYHEAVVGNMLAVHSDAAYLHHGLVPYGPGHNSVFLVCAAMWGGERAAAYKFVRVMQQIYREAPERGDGPDGSMAWSYPMVVALRFGDWDGVAGLDSMPPSNFSTQWPYGYGLLRSFSLAVAGIHLGHLREAEAEMKSLRSFLPAVALKERPELTNLSLIANHTVSAVHASAQGNSLMAVEAMKRAVDIEMSMPYDEPPNWLLPSRECYGQALLNAGRPDDAEKVFRSALYGHSFHAEPHCGWAIFGLRESLRRQVQTSARAMEVEALTRQLEAAWLHADVVLSSACEHLGRSQKPLFT
eukprot:TRINITY_DN13673_c0_g1_i1.p1 TRINITY_DN13673_c0_g1~~TRINITY_DN13673_c0_g1_i1.p1  ORF type:complete len:584 (-),score=132.65 TRINITY_DN13673_c0_g1_i1:102-1853(-)